MPTYLLFDFPDYYPSGGMHDCRATFVAADDTAALQRAEELREAAPYPGLEVNVELWRLDDEDWTCVAEAERRHGLEGAAAGPGPLHAVRQDAGR
jgi:hypothetical protein